MLLRRSSKTGSCHRLLQPCVIERTRRQASASSGLVSGTEISSSREAPPTWSLGRPMTVVRAKILGCTILHELLFLPQFSSSSSICNPFEKRERCLVRGYKNVVSKVQISHVLRICRMNRHFRCWPNSPNPECSSRSSPSAYSHFYLAYKVGLFFCSSTPHSRIAVAPRSLEIGRIYHGLPWECTMVRAEEIVHANIASASSEDLGHAQISITHILVLGALRGEPNWNLIRVFNGGRSTETFSKNQHPLPHFHERSALRGFFAVVVSALQKMVNHPRLLKSSTVIVFPNCPEVAHAYTIDTAIWESGVFR